MKQRQNPACIKCGRTCRWNAIPCSRCRKHTQTRRNERIAIACPAFAEDRESRICFYMTRAERNLPLFGRIA